MTVTVDDTDVVDFTDSRPRVEFRIGSQTYEGHRALPAGVLMAFAAGARDAQGEADDDLRQEKMERLFQMVLRRESAERFLRCLNDITVADEQPDDVVTLPIMMKLIPWVLEQHGMRPTEPSAG